MVTAVIKRGGTVEIQSRLSVLLWGKPKAGKTTFAATAPGEKLWINCDEDGFDSVRHREDCHLLDVSGFTNDQFFNQMENSNPLGLSKILNDHPKIETVVVDSATAIFERSLEQAIDIDKAGLSRNFSPSLAVPGISAYGARTAHLGAILRSLLRVTRAKNRHLIITAHEDTPLLNDNGSVRAIKIMLSDKAINNTSAKFSEIWYLQEKDDGRYLTIRPVRKRSPMGTRMFEAKSDSRREFKLSYDATLPDKGQKHLIANWFHEWVQGGGKKLPVPK